jgi:hypothetical protein
MKSWLSRILIGVVLIGTMSFLTGCKTTENEDLSQRPWNAPMNWEHGLPSSMMERR